MHIDDMSKILEGHFREGLIAQYACIVYEDVHLAPQRTRLLDHVRDRGKVGYRCRIRDCLASGSANFFNYRLRCGSAGTNAGDGSAEVVHDNLRSTARQKKCVL